MRKLTVELETVTPLFMAGAEARGPAELRAPSFRGALRYWLRAIADNYAVVEAAAFGNTQAAGQVATRVNGTTTSVTFNKRAARNAPPSGYDYLLWSMNESGNERRGNYQKPHQYVPEGTHFELTMSTRATSQEADTSFQDAYAALWLLLQLGGIGSRSRRTGGSLRVSQITDTDDELSKCGLSVQTQSSDAAALARELGNGLNMARTLVHSTRRETTIPSEFDVIQPSACRIWVISDHWKSSMEAIEGIGTALREFRSYREPDHRNVAPWLQGSTPPGMSTVERAIFGLPLPFRYSNNGPSGVVQGRRNEIERRASPLWLHVTKLGDRNFVGVATLFKSAFLPRGENLHAGCSTIRPPTNYSLIETFIKESFVCNEVTL